jgi:hypothetical protein
LWWTRRAWECFKTAGELIHAAKAATALAKIHLQAMFTQVALLKVPYDLAAVDKAEFTRLESVKIDYTPTTSPLSGEAAIPPAPAPAPVAAPGPATAVAPGNGKAGQGEGGGDARGKEGPPWKSLTVDTTAVDRGKGGGKGTEAPMRRRNSDASDHRARKSMGISSPVARQLEGLLPRERSVSPMPRRASLEDAEPAAR